MNVTCALCGQASEMASFVQAKRDLGCKAPQVTVLEEGINTESRWAKEFWSLLGGKTQYRGTYTHLLCKEKGSPIHKLFSTSNDSNQ